MTLPSNEPWNAHSPLDVTEILPAEPAEANWAPVEPRPRRVLLPVLLFLATCCTTYAAGGPAYAGPVMLILLCHELGHFFQTLRYHVPASLPFFIPMLPPLGTMGAVIGMGGNMSSRKALFDIGISGPLAGLVPALVCSVVGLHFSTLVDSHLGAGHLEFGEPLLFKFLVWCVMGPVPSDKTVMLHPLGFAGWVGIFITALNLIPIGQLDGGHILYAILRKKSHAIASLLFAAALGAVILTGNYGWSLMLALLFLTGPRHPPTANDAEPLGTGRVILGLVTLSFVIIGFTPVPIAQA